MPSSHQRPARHAYRSPHPSSARASKYTTGDSDGTPVRSKAVQGTPRTRRATSTPTLKPSFIIIAILITLALALMLHSTLNRPPDLSPPSHYTFTVLPIVSDFIALTMALRQIHLKVRGAPLFRQPVSDKAYSAIDGLQDSLRELQHWYVLRVESFPLQAAPGAIMPIGGKSDNSRHIITTK